MLGRKLRALIETNISLKTMFFKQATTKLKMNELGIYVTTLKTLGISGYLLNRDVSHSLLEVKKFVIIPGLKFNFIEFVQYIKQQSFFVSCKGLSFEMSINKLTHSFFNVLPVKKFRKK